MPPPELVTPPRRISRTRRIVKLDPGKVDELRQAGLSGVDIAQHQGVHKTTIYRYLASTDPERQAVATFHSDRASIYDKLCLQSLNVQSAIVQSLLDENGVLTLLTPHQKTGLLAVLSAQHGTLYDKMRLERGQSTGNISIVHKLMSAAFDRAGKTTTDGSTPEPPTPDKSCA